MTTNGVPALLVRALLIRAVQVHPESARHIDSLRPSILDALPEPSQHVALLRIAQEHPDIAAQVRTYAQEAQNEQASALVFGRQVSEADDAIHSLDDLRESQKFSRSGDVRIFRFLFLLSFE